MVVQRPAGFRLPQLSPESPASFPDLLGSGVVIFVVTVFLLLFVRARWGSRKRSSAEAIVPSEQYSKVPNSLLTRQAFSVERVPPNLDAIVVGSGIGGLSTASILARQGKCVLVLERHDVAGGCTHTFTEGGYEFDTGVHYVGGRVGESGSCANRMFDYITDGAVRWEAMDDEFDVAVRDGGARGRRAEFPVRRDVERFRRDLREKFPDDADAVDAYFELKREVDRSVPFLFLLRFLPLVLPDFAARRLAPLLLRRMPLFLRSTWDVLSSVTTNADLIGMMTYNWGDYGEPPARGSFAVQAMLAGHYDGGGYYPVGGPSTIARAVVRVVERAGGRVLVKAPVEAVLVDGSGKGAYGVRVNGHDILAPVVVSDAGAPNTFGKLIPPEQRHLVERQLQDLQESGVAAKTSSVSLFVGLGGTAEELRLPRRNIWIFPTWDHDMNCARYEEDMTAPFPVMFVSFPSSKDPLRRDKKGVAEIIALANYADFEEYGDRPVKHRGEKYEALKRDLGERLLAHLLKEFPQLKDKVDFWELGTPVTNDHYLGNYRGAIYGVSHTPKRFRCEWLSAKTPVRNLYLTGQDAFCCGIQGSAFGGVLCAAAISPMFCWMKLPAFLH